MSHRAAGRSGCGSGMQAITRNEIGWVGQPAARAPEPAVAEQVKTKIELPRIPVNIDKCNLSTAKSDSEQSAPLLQSALCC